MKFLKKSIYVFAAAILCAASLCACGGTGDTNSASSAPKEEKVLMVGDSLFDLWKGTCEKDLAGAPNLTNIAVGGTNGIYWSKSEKLIIREAPTKIVISLGTNDIADLRRTGREAAECDTGLQNVLQTFHEACPDAYMYLLTVNICGEPIRWSLKDEITECNSVMREYCSRYDWVEIVETEYAFYDDDDYTKKPNPEYFVNDYLHFSSKGYSRLKPIVRGALQLD